MHPGSGHSAKGVLNVIRIIDGVAYLGQPGQHLDVRAHQLGNGHIEVTGSRRLDWHELEWTRDQVADHVAMVERYREENADELHERYVKQAARRAKTRVRRLCKAMGVDTMLTLTYRANQTDLALCKRHLKEFNRRLLRVMPGFSFVAAFERQERGAWHVHLATTRVPQSILVSGHEMAYDRNARARVKVKSYDAIRSVWRGVVGDLGGNIDVARRKFNTMRSPAQIASYIAGYIVKEFAAGERWSNRWTKYGDIDVPPPVVLGSVSTVLDCLEVSFSLLHESASVVKMHLNKWRDSFYLAAEGMPLLMT